jgi:hypothetical protein
MCFDFREFNKGAGSAVRWGSARGWSAVFSTKEKRELPLQGTLPEGVTDWD